MIPTMISHSAIPTIRVLLVDDENSVRRIAARILSSRGFDVCECSCAEAALSIAEASQHEFDVLVTDAVMPGMSGVELASRITIVDPAIAVVLMSGYGEDDIGNPLAGCPSHHFLQKPFQADELVAVISRAANLRRAAAA